MGRAAAIAFAHEGADVAINYLPDEEPDAREVVALIQAEGRKGPSASRALRGIDVAKLAGRPNLRGGPGQGGNQCWRMKRLLAPGIDTVRFAERFGIVTRGERELDAALDQRLGDRI